MNEWINTWNQLGSVSVISFMCLTWEDYLSNLGLSKIRARIG